MLFDFVLNVPLLNFDLTWLGSNGIATLCGFSGLYLPPVSRIPSYPCCFKYLVTQSGIDVHANDVLFFTSSSNAHIQSSGFLASLSQ